MEKIKNQNGIYGCVILSTCNRLEVWASVMMRRMSVFMTASAR